MAQQLDELFLLRAQPALVQVHQHIPHTLVLGRAFFSTRWYCSSARCGMGDAHM